jgi:hypothetical protein
LRELLGCKFEVIIGVRLNDLQSALALRNDIREGKPERRWYQNFFVAYGIEDVV